MKLGFIEKIGSIGSFIAAGACPACFPLLAVVGGVLGLGVLRPYEGMVFVIFRILVLVALTGNIISYFNHHKIIPLIAGVASPLLIFFSIYVYWNTIILYLGLFGLLISSILNYIAKRKCKSCMLKEPI